MKKKILLFFICFPLFVIFIRPVIAVGTAKLSLTPATGNYTVDEAFPVVVKVDTGGEKINQVKINLSYSTSLLEFTGVSKTGSFVTNWLVESSATPGLLTYTGGLPTPGTTGSSLTFLTLNFKAKASGTASLTFGSGSVVYLDQPGTTLTTNILSLNQSTEAEYIIVTSTAELPTPTLPTSGDLPDTADFKTTLIFVLISLSLIFFGAKKFIHHLDS